MNEKPIKIFITYAHEDARYKQELEEHLAVMEQKGEIVLWSDNEILPGGKWSEKISENISDSDILLFLTSARSLASESCKKELSEALNKNISLIPIILEHCDWKNHEISDFQALPTDEQRDLKPVCAWESQSEAWQAVIDGIRTNVKALKDQASSRPPPHTDADKWFQRGNASLFLGQFQSAIHAYDQAILLNSQFAKAYTNRGVAKDKLGWHEEAMADYDQAIELNPQYADAYNNRGFTKVKLRQYQEAIAYFDQAIRINPQLADAYYNRGEVYLCCGKWDEAREDLSKAKEMGVDIARLFRNTYRRLKDFEKKFQIKLPDDIKRLLSSDQEPIVTNLAEYIKEIKQPVPGDSKHLYIYRGQKNDEWPVRSSAIRRLQKERLKYPELMPYLFMGYIHQMIDEVQLRYASNYRNLTALECMAHLQHNRVATGLIDFTYNPLVALWFACEVDGTADGKVFVVNSQSDKVEEIKTKNALAEDLKKFFEIQPEKVKESETEKTLGDAPMGFSEEDRQWYLWQPSIGNSNIDDQRMTMQQSVFLFGGSKVEEAGMVEREFIIPGEHKRTLRQELEAMGISDKMLFSDLAGFFERNTTQSIYNRELAEDYYTEEIRKSKARNDKDIIIGENYFQRANFRVALNEYEDAIKDYDQAIELNSEYDEAYNGRGVAKYELSQHEEAIKETIKEAIKEAIEKMIEEATEETIKKAIEKMIKEAIEKMIEEAIADFNQAIHINPQSANAYNNRGDIKYELGEYEEAIADFDQAIRFNPQFAIAYYNRGNAKVKLDRYQEAIVDYDQAVRLSPQDADTYYDRGNAKKALGRYEDAIADYNQAIHLNPEYAKAYNNRGEVYLCCGKWDEAREDLIKAKEMGVDIVRAFRNTYQSFKDFEKKFGIKLPADIKKLLSDGGD